jgi:2-dehydro-3-deoxyphosphogluconate aldolase / (4S)-4-hydroxy-2-oxoglutarate aldolase
MTPQVLLAQVEVLRIFAVIRTETADQAVEAGRACLRGGIRLLEVTFTVPGAPDAIRRLAREEGALLGAGSIVARDQVRAARDAGAVFTVSPHCDPDLAAEAKGQGLSVALGGVTPTELLACQRAGADIVKIFPASALGPAYLKAVREPLPFLRLMPTGGVDADNMRAYLDAGAVAVGMAGSLLPKADVAGGRWDAITARARDLVSAVDAWRKGPR